MSTAPAPSPDRLDLLPSGPFCLLAGADLPWFFNERSATDSGIYLFTVRTGAGERVAYVGETGRAFRERLREHLFLYLNGTYNIYDSSQFAVGTLVELWHGMLHLNDARRAHEFLARHRELVPHLDRQLRTLRIWLLRTTVDRRTRRLMESAIARALKGKPAPIGTFHEAGVRYEYREAGEPSVKFSVRESERFLGLPARLST